MTRTGILSSLGILAALTGCQHPVPRECQVEPRLFCAPYAELAAELPARTQRKLASMSSEELGRSHFDLGMYVRNRFGHWQDDEVGRYFRDNGVVLSDSMSTPFLEGYVLFLQGKPADMKDLIARHAPPPMIPEAQ